MEWRRGRAREDAQMRRSKSGAKGRLIVPYVFLLFLLYLVPCHVISGLQVVPPSVGDKCKVCRGGSVRNKGRRV